MDATRPVKRRKLERTEEPFRSSEKGSIEGETTVDVLDLRTAHERPISPPPVRRTTIGSSSTPIVTPDLLPSPTIIPSPVNLIRIDSVSSTNNIDTVTLHDILGDPLIQECWGFNYLFDVDFLMSQFDRDVKDLVQVKIVHGSWKKDSSNRLRIEVGNLLRSSYAAFASIGVFLSYDTCEPM